MSRTYVVHLGVISTEMRRVRGVRSVQSGPLYTEQITLDRAPILEGRHISGVLSKTDLYLDVHVVSGQTDRAASLMPNDSRKRCNEISWSTVSNVADRSRRTSAATPPRSTAERISDITRNTAVSVEWRAPYGGR